MRFEIKLAIRYVTARKGSLARLTAVFAVVGIALGVAALIVADSLARGFADEMREKILANTAHIKITPNDDDRLADSDSMIKVVRSVENVVDAVPGAYEHSVVSSDRATSYALLSADASESVRIGGKLAERLRIVPGEKVEIVTIGNQKPSRITVDAILETGISDYDSTLISMPRRKFAAVVGDSEFLPRSIDVRVADIYRTPETARKIGEALGGRVTAADWQETNRALFTALGLERRVVWVIVSLIVLIAGLNITTSLALLVNERRFDIGVLRACGARRRSVIAIFLIESVLLGIGGVVSGFVIGLAACVAGNRFRLVSLTDGVYSVSFVPFHPNAAILALIVLAVLLLTLFSGIYPAMMAGRVRPSANLRAN